MSFADAEPLMPFDMRPDVSLKIELMLSNHAFLTLPVAFCAFSCASRAKDVRLAFSARF